MVDRRLLAALALMALTPGLVVSTGPAKPAPPRRPPGPSSRENADGSTTWCCHRAYMFEGEHDDECIGLPVQGPVVVDHATTPLSAHEQSSVAAERLEHAGADIGLLRLERLAPKPRVPTEAERLAQEKRDRKARMRAPRARAEWRRVMVKRICGCTSGNECVACTIERGGRGCPCHGLASVWNREPTEQEIRDTGATMPDGSALPESFGGGR